MCASSFYFFWKCIWFKLVIFLLFAFCLIFDFFYRYLKNFMDLRLFFVCLFVIFSDFELFLVFFCFFVTLLYKSARCWVGIWLVRISNKNVLK